MGYRGGGGVKLGSLGSRSLNRHKFCFCHFLSCTQLPWYEKKIPETQLKWDWWISRLTGLHCSGTLHISLFVLFDGSPLILSVLVLSMAARWAYTRLKAPHSIISDKNVRWSKIFLAYNSPISRKQTCLSHVYVLSSCTKIGSSSVDNNLIGYFEKLHHWPHSIR